FVWAGEQSLAQLVQDHIVEAEIKLPRGWLFGGIDDLLEVPDRFVEEAVLSVDEAVEPGDGPRRRGQLLGTQRVEHLPRFGQAAGLDVDAGEVQVSMPLGILVVDGEQFLESFFRLAQTGL